MFLCLIQVSLFLNLRLFDVISHFLPNLFVTGIILDYLHLVSENPRPLLFLEKKKNLLGGDIHPHPHLKPLYSQSFLQSTSMILCIHELLIEALTVSHTTIFRV